MNAVLMSALRRHPEACGVAVLQARQPPPDDDGLALGPGWVARPIGDGIDLPGCKDTDH